MARNTTWHHNIDRVIDELNRLPCPVVDRATIEKLFSVSRRHSLRILQRFRPTLAGKSLVIDRKDLLNKLQLFRDDPGVRFECERHKRVRDEIGRLRQESRARQIEIAVPREAWDRNVSDLPPTVDLRYGALKITFTDTQDLLRQLFELSQAITNDFSHFQGICEPPSSKHQPLIT